MSDVVLDAIGKKCPIPVLMTKKELNKMISGQILELKVDDKGALKDVPALLNKTGDKLIETHEQENEIIFIIEKL